MNNSEFFRTAGEWLIIIIPFALPLYFVARKLTRIFFRARLKQVIFAWAITLIVSPIVAVCVYFFALEMMFYEPKRKFDQTRWLRDAHHRFQMADDLVERKTLEGIDTTQLKAIIGNKPETKTDTLWTYFIGTGGGIFLDHFLNIKIKGAKTVRVSHTAREG